MLDDGLGGRRDDHHPQPPDVPEARWTEAGSDAGLGGMGAATEGLTTRW